MSGHKKVSLDFDDDFLTQLLSELDSEAREAADTSIDFSGMTASQLLHKDNEQIIGQSDQPAFICAPVSLPRFAVRSQGMQRAINIGVIALSCLIVCGLAALVFSLDLNMS